MFYKVTSWLHGRTTTFLLAFFVLGHVLHFIGKLDATYISFMVTFMGFVLGHSYKEDKSASTEQK